MTKLFVDKSIEVDASPSDVWNVLTKSEFTSQWAHEFSSDGPRFHLESDWQLSSPVLWKDENNKVIVEGRVTALEPGKLLRFTVFDVRQKERPPVTKEDGITFELAEQNGKTRLHLLQGDFSVMTDGEMYRRMSEEIWDRVLPKIKSMAEGTREIQTCGKGLAENSALPRKLGELISALADNLDLHIKALDLKDENARREHDAYENLVRQSRQIAQQLQVMGHEMASYRDLPMGAHDENAMSDIRFFQAFEKFVRTKRELLTLLQSGVAQDQQMLDAMRNSSREQEHARSQTATS